MFDRNHEPISSDANKNIRKSMNSIKLADSVQSNNVQSNNYPSSSYTDDVRNSPLKQSTASALRQPPKPQMNSSSSQSSLASMTGIVDLGNKRRSAMGQPNQGPDLRNDPVRTNFVDSKPVNADSIGRTQAASKTFDDNIIKPNLLANVQSKNADSSSEPEECKTFSNVRQSMKQTIQAVPVASVVQTSQYSQRKQDRRSSSSHSDDNDDGNSDGQQPDPSNNEDDEVDQDNDVNDEEDEFPVALNGLVFSFLPAEIADKLNNVIDWK